MKACSKERIIFFFGKWGKVEAKGCKFLWKTHPRDPLVLCNHGKSIAKRSHVRDQSTFYWVFCFNCFLKDEIIKRILLLSRLLELMPGWVADENQETRRGSWFSKWYIPGAVAGRRLKTSDPNGAPRRGAGRRSISTLYPTRNHYLQYTTIQNILWLNLIPFVYEIFIAGLSLSTCELCILIDNPLDFR